MVGKWKARLHDWVQARDLELVGSFLLLGLLMLAFIEIGDEVTEQTPSIDQRLLLALRRPGDPSVGIGGDRFEGMVRDVTALGSGTITGMLSVALVGYFILIGRPGAALFVAAAVVGSWLLNDALKAGFARERPTVVPHLMGASEPSFPSGHTMISATLYPTLAELFGRFGTRRRVRVYLMALGVGLAALVGWSRIYLGVHYPTDVLAGLCMGFGWALFCGIVARVLQKRGVFTSANDGN